MYADYKREIAFSCTRNFAVSDVCTACNAYVCSIYGP